MKKIGAIVILLAIALAGMAQGQVPLTREEKKILRKERKKQDERMMTINTSQALHSSQFILKADRVMGRDGLMFNVNPRINFVSVQGDEAYVQLGSDTGIGYNGVGGVTLKGKVTSFKLDQEEKNGNYFVQLSTIGTGGGLTISMHVNVTGDMANATVQTNWGSRVDFIGKIVPAGKMQVYKGTESY
jgi:hypothetical protein